MPFQIAIALRGAAPDRRPLVAPCTAGGSRADLVHLPGLPPGALALVPRAAGVVVEPRVPGVRVGGRLVAPGARRLLRPGERLEIQDGLLALDRAAGADEAATRSVAAALLRDAAAGDGVAAGPHLLVLTGPAAGDRHVLGRERTLGRGRRAAIRIRDPQASRLHACLRTGADGTTVEDLGSKNGLRVNGVRVDGKRHPLRPGDELTVGETALLLEDPWAAAIPASDPPHPGRGSARARPGWPSSRLAAAALLALSAAALALAS